MRRWGGESLWSCFGDRSEVDVREVAEEGLASSLRWGFIISFLSQIGKKGERRRKEKRT